ncbi:MAG TPA: hypothetical protein VIT68_01640 [Candidatus Gracilibacteria bacterium]
MIDLSSSKNEKDFVPGFKIKVWDKMQQNYEYVLSQPLGENFNPEFKPQLTPVQMLTLGVFEGKYLNDCTGEFPKEWYQSALEADKLSPQIPDITKNYFAIKSRQPLSVWIEKNWITPDDPDVRGWFQWYCRYYIGRRDAALDSRQIKRWKAFARHRGQILKNCQKGDLHCRPRQRQALLQWAYDPFI